MSIDRANLPGAGAARITFDGGNFWTRDDVVPRLAAPLRDQRSSMYGVVTKTRGGRKIEVDVPLFGLWENLTVLFPAALMNPAPGARYFGTVDKPLVIHAKNQDRLTIHNARLTGLANLRLAAEQEIFSGVARFTGLIKNNAAPTDANAYFTYDTAAFVDAGFAMTNFRAQAWTGVWGARTGFGAIRTEAGWQIDWDLALDDDPVDGLGPVDMFVGGLSARARAITVGPTAAQLHTNLFFQGDAKAAVGAGIHESVDDLVLTCGASSVTLKNAALVESGWVFAPTKKRIGESVWETTVGFTAGVPQAVAAVA
jgi:hypothetical protein